MIKVGSDFSGVGAFNQALIRLGVNYKEVFACDMDKYARQTFIHNYGEPEYYPTNVYDREIPAEPLDIYMTSPPCQAFSLAGKRLGKEDKRGILFFNSYEFIRINKPRFFIFENVKGLLSDDGGNTFNEWVNMLGGKSVNGEPVLFPYDDSVPYHLYWKVLNAKHHGVPQNRERVFLIGIRDDKDNTFRWPIEEYLSKRLKDVLEDDVDEKYYLSEKAIEGITNTTFCSRSNLLQEKDYSDCICARDYKDAKCVKVKSATSKGYEEASEGNSINFSVQTLDTACNQEVIIYDDYNQKINKSGIAGTLTCNIGSKSKGNGQKILIQNDSCNQEVICDAIRGRNTEDGLQQQLELNSDITSNSITTVQKDNVLFVADYRADEGLRIRKDDISPCMTSSMQEYTEWKPNAGTRNHPLVGNNYRIRRLTPRECFRLMDFPDSFSWPVSDSQAYKQAGNSIVVNVLYKIIKNLPL